LDGVELLPVLGALGDVVLLELEPPIEPDELPPEVLPEVLPLVPDVPPLLELEPDLLKCASHSEREIWPSLLVSTEEKLGVVALPLELELGELELDVPPAAPVDDLPLLDELPLADGEAADGLVLDEEESAAAAASERAKSAAAVVTVTVLSICITPLWLESPRLRASGMPV
jgi:hypothetical protein